jgi:hypothetical protein
MGGNPQNAPYNFARTYSYLGYRVLPLAPGEKRPHGALVPNGLKEASLEVATLEAWWRSCPRCGVGILAPEGVLVLDFDDPTAWDALSVGVFGPRGRPQAEDPQGGRAHLPPPP